MDDITLNVIVLLIILCLAAAIFWWVRRRQANQENALRHMAAEWGWRFVSIREPLAWGFQMIGPGWMLEAMSRSDSVEAGPGSSNIAESTCWQAACPGGTILIGPRLSPAYIDDSIIREISQHVVSHEMGVAAGSLQEVEAGSRALNQRYSLWADTVEDLKILLSPPVEAALLNWRGKEPVIKRTQGTLQIAVQGVRYTTAGDLNSIIQLGEALIINSKEAK